MTETVMTKDQGIALLNKLAADDAFRLRYERNPAAALKELLPAALVDALPARNLRPINLAEKAMFAEGLRQLRKDAAEVCLCQMPPNMRLANDVQKEFAAAVPQHVAA